MDRWLADRYAGVQPREYSGEQSTPEIVGPRVTRRAHRLAGDLLADLDRERRKRRVRRAFGWFVALTCVLVGAAYLCVRLGVV